MESECLLRVKNGSPAWASECPLLGVKQTSISGDWRSVHSQELTSAQASAKVSSRPNPDLRGDAVTDHSIEIDLSPDTFTPMLGDSTSDR